LVGFVDATMLLETVKKGSAMIEISKEVFLQLVRSHAKLSQAEYQRNPAFNDSHYAHKTETALIPELVRLDLLGEVT
jgi:hypothetical protein